MKPIRWVMGAGLLLVGVLGVSYMQERFDGADLRKSLRAIQTKFPEARDCKAEITSRFRGKVLVTCSSGAWMVDVVGGVISAP